MSTTRARGTPRLLDETAAGRLSLKQVFPPRRALARGHGALLFTAMALVAFAVIFSLVKRQRSHAVDLRVTRRLQGVNSTVLDRVMHLVSWPGFPPQSRIIPPLLPAIWLALGFPLEAAFQALAWGSGGLSTLFKRIMRRPRPNADDVRVVPARIGGSSFPSGHVLIYTSVYGFLAFLLETLVRPPAIRRIATAALVSLIALVGPSRVYLGHHWFSDVVASYLLSTSYLLALMALYRRAKTRWLNRRR